MYKMPSIDILYENSCLVLEIVREMHFRSLPSKIVKYVL